MERVSRKNRRTHCYVFRYIVGGSRWLANDGQEGGSNEGLVNTNDGCAASDRSFRYVECSAARREYRELHVPLPRHLDCLSLTVQWRLRRWPRRGDSKWNLLRLRGVGGFFRYEYCCTFSG